MSQTDTLKSLEIVLESFLDRAVELKSGRLDILSGLNRLDDIARDGATPEHDPIDLADQVGGWFAEHQGWLKQPELRPGDRNRLGQILDNIRGQFDPGETEIPARQKIAAELERWRIGLDEVPTAPPVAPETVSDKKLVLKRGPESLEEAGVHPSSSDSIELFAGSLQALTNMFRDRASESQHLMSILDDALKSASIQSNREALLLSALLIYYLKQNGYMVQPFVKRLKEAERLHREETSNA